MASCATPQEVLDKIKVEYKLGYHKAGKMAEINTLIITSKQIKFQNEKLIEKQNEYALYFEQLDSIYSIENKIQNILQTYYENDSNKINSILEKNKFNHISSSKVKLDVEGLEGWQENAQNKNMDKIPFFCFNGTGHVLVSFPFCLFNKNLGNI